MASLIHWNCDFPFSLFPNRRRHIVQPARIQISSCIPKENKRFPWNLLTHRKDFYTHHFRTSVIRPCLRFSLCKTKRNRTYDTSIWYHSLRTKHTYKRNIMPARILNWTTVGLSQTLCGKPFYFNSGREENMIVSRVTYTQKKNWRKKS